jgi:hypothetical protein
MKKFFLFLSVCFVVSMANAQNYEAIKNTVILNQYQKAKEDIDKQMTNTKFTSKPEAYILKTTIYSALSMEEANKNNEQGKKLAEEADAAFKKYKEMDPAMSLIDDLVYQNGPINLYSNYYSSGYHDYTEKKWVSAYGKLKKAVVYSDLLIDKKLLTASVDTNVLILAGITAENIIPVLLIRKSKVMDLKVCTVFLSVIIFQKKIILLLKKLNPLERNCILKVNSSISIK